MFHKGQKLHLGSFVVKIKVQMYEMFVMFGTMLLPNNMFHQHGIHYTSSGLYYIFGVSLKIHN